MNSRKYLKYKNKYLELKNKLFGGANGIKTLYISIGIPGSGKTSRFQRSANIHKGVRFEADEYPGLYNPSLVFEKLRDAHQWCKDNVQASMEQAIEDIYQSNTNLNPRDMLDYLELADRFGYQVKIIIPEEHNSINPLEGNLLHYPNSLTYEQQKNHLKYVRSGQIEDQKQIPPEAMERMITLYEQNIGLIRRIKKELDEIDSESNPRSWIEKINFYFPPPPIRKK
jgi:hypothetical protein